MLSPLWILVTASAFTAAAVSQSVGAAGRLVRVVTVPLSTITCWFAASVTPAVTDPTAPVTLATGPAATSACTAAAVCVLGAVVPNITSNTASSSTQQSSHTASAPATWTDTRIGPMVSVSVASSTA